MKIASLKTFISKTESALWYGYLLLLIGISFLSNRPFDSSWLGLATLFFFFCGIYLTALLAGANFNKIVFYQARLPIILSLLMLFWLIVQCSLPIANGLYDQIFDTSLTPDWFNYEAILSVKPHLARRMLLSEVFVISWLLLTLSLITSRKRIKELLITIILIGFVHALIGLYAKFGNYVLVNQKELDGHFDVARGLFVNRNHYASFISITLIGAITYFIKGLMLEWRERRPVLLFLDLLLSTKILYFTAALIGLIAIMLSQSRAGLFGLLGAFVIVFLLLMFFDKRVLNRSGVFLMTATLSILLLFFFGQDLFERLSSDGFSLGERLDQWKITCSAIKDSPLTGYGAGSYSTIFQIYREQEELRQVVFDQAHNEYLHLWLEQGLIGLALLLMFVMTVFFKSVRIYRRSSSRLVSALVVSALIVMVSVLTQAFVDFNLQIINIRCFFFVIIGLIFASASLSKKLVY